MAGLAEIVLMLGVVGIALELVTIVVLAVLIIRGLIENRAGERRLGEITRLAQMENSRHLHRMERAAERSYRESKKYWSESKAWAEENRRLNHEHDLIMRMIFERVDREHGDSGAMGA